MRKPVVAGNWKMNCTVEETRSLVYELSVGLRDISNVEKILFPPYISLLPAAALLEGTNIGLGAQNVYWEEKGAFTGEVSARMIAEFCQYVIIGHSERRTYFAESDEAVNKKIFASLNHGLVPIVCVGETLEEKESGWTEQILTKQIKEGLKNITGEYGSTLIIAYEPVWAIGTGKASTGKNASDVVSQIIRPALKDVFDPEIANSTRVIYGGSVTAANASEFFNYEEIDGALVGGASLKAEEFIKITQACSK